MIEIEPGDSLSEYQAKIEYLKALELKLTLTEGLPHLYGWPWYKWAHDWFHTKNKEAFLCAANQISKSSTMIRQAINYATDRELWPQLWKSRPLTFWYLYPSKEVGTIEFEKKWKEEFLPRGQYRGHKDYGWRADYRNKNIFAIHFNTGVSIYFKSYGQDTQELQTGSCWAIFADEELPETHFSELRMRTAATDGYFRMVFTATLGQELWRRTMEETGEYELFPDAYKAQISMYDCQSYMDGTLSDWTDERITRVINSCKSEAEVQRRVFGRFVSDSGLVYPSYNQRRNFIRHNNELWPNAHYYGAVDPGGGGSSHPTGIVFLKVNQSFTKARVIASWRGDDVTTTAGDAFTKFLEMRTQLRQQIGPEFQLDAQVYDWASKDFDTISTRSGEGFTPAEKATERGESILNVLFKNEMLTIDRGSELPNQNDKLDTELRTVKKEQPKNKRKDDLIDPTRYLACAIPWDWSAIKWDSLAGGPVKERPLSEIELRRKAFMEETKEEHTLHPDTEMEEYNEILGF